MTEDDDVAVPSGAEPPASQEAGGERAALSSPSTGAGGSDAALTDSVARTGARSPRASRGAARYRYYRIVVRLVEVVGIIAVAALVAAAVLGVIAVPGRSSRSVLVVVPAGASTDAIAARLARAGVVPFAWEVQVLARLRGVDGSLRTGAYALRTGMTPSAALSALERGPVAAHVLTVPEGLTESQIAVLIAHATHQPLAAVNAALGGGGFTAPLRPAGAPLEGLLFPATYPLYPGESLHGLIQAMLTQSSKMLASDHLSAAPQGLTPYQVLIVASLVQAEALRPVDAPRVARVIDNRLQAGMPLELDSTVRYALGHPVAHVSITDTQVASPYNTYAHPGLPPTPIDSPGQAAIMAALHPASGSWLYFVVTGPGGAESFTSNYAQFLKDKAAGQAAGFG